MPNIRQYENQDKLQPNDLAAESMEKEGRHDESTAQVVRNNWDQGIDKVQRGLLNLDAKQDAATGSAMMADVAQFTVDAHKQLSQTLNSADAGSGVDPLDKFNSDYLQPGLQAIRDKYADNDTVTRSFDEHANDLYMNLNDRGNGEWDQITRQQTATNMKSTGDSLANAATLSPADVDGLAAQSDKMIDGFRGMFPSRMNGAEADAMKKQQREGIYNSAATSALDAVMKNPTASLNDIDQLRTVFSGDNFKDNMTPETYSRVMGDLDKTRLTRQTAASMSIKDNMPDMLAHVRQFGDDQGVVPKYIGAYAADSPDRTMADQANMQKQYQEALNEHDANKAIGDLPRDQAAAYVSGLKGKAQSATGMFDVGPATDKYNAAVKALKDRDEEFGKDPSAYMINHNDTVGALYQAYQKNPTPQSFQQYAAFTAAQQQHMYPGTSPQVLTPEIKQNFKSQFSAIDQTPQGATTAMSLLANLKQTTGQYYTGAVHELIQDKIIKPSQYVAGVLMARPESQMLAQEVMHASSVPDDVMNKTSPLSEDKALSLARQAYAPLASTLRGSANGQDLLDSYITSTAAVIRQRAAYSGGNYVGAKGNSGQDAADATAIANQSVLGRYNIKSGMRIPTNYDQADVVGGAQSVLGDLGNHNLNVSPNYSGLINGKDQFAKDIASDGYWVTNPKGDGAILYFQGSPVMEKNKAGVNAPLALDFNTMQTLGKQNRSTLNEAGRFVTNPGSL